ncbi:ankyrin repeat-containing domain-containing protein [Artemisia annua]|uniref:Ankyrin repeat-containing domain-containing protein n=1 Tax=Artemisia annua TaxID=35608 RepID=A0A2U1NFT9_ARTAN|nr:ankyrin repeat-containing domain-containing protein [Artemisia annua]
MDRLVKHDVKELNIVFTRNQKCSTTFKLTNLMHTMPVAVFVETTNALVLSLTRSYGVIPPLGSVVFTLVCQELDQPLVLATQVIVRSSMLLTGKSDQESLCNLFSKPGKHIFKDGMIPVSFVGSHVIDFLISNHVPKSVDVPLILEKSVPFCDGTELNSLLKSAAMTGKSYLVTFLISAGADVNDRDTERKSVMSLAIESGNLDVVRVIIESGFVIDHLNDRYLHDAASINGVDIMELLCMNYLDIDINSIDSRGRTAMHVAANHGHLEVLDFLTTLGSDASVVDNDGWNPLHHASYKGHVAAVEFLLNSCSYIKNAVTKNGKSPIALAYENDNMELYDMLYLGDVLHKAATIDDVNGINKCLTEGANVNGKDQNGWTALHRAAFKGRIESVKVLLDHGASVDIVDNSGCTPLHRAVEMGYAEVATVLVARGARASIKSLIDHMVFDLDCVKNYRSLVNPLC